MNEPNFHVETVPGPFPPGNRHGLRRWSVWAFPTLLSIVLLSCGLASSVYAQADVGEQGEAVKISTEVRAALTPLLGRLTKADRLRATVKMTVTSAVGEEILGTNGALFQVASQAPNLMAMSAKFDTEAVQFVGDGKRLYAKMSETEYLDLATPKSLSALVTAMPIQLGPQPIPMLSFSFAGVNPVVPLMSGLKSLELVAKANDGSGATAKETKTIRAVTPEGLAWELTFTAGTDARPTGLMVDMTEMIKQTNNLQVPEGYSFKIQYDFERWDVDTDLPAGIFEFKPPKDGQRFESLADYMVRDGAIGNHPLLGKPAPTFTARLFEGEEVTFEHDPDGKVVLLDFWATWCGPCVEALPELQQLAEKFKGKDVTFYAVNVNETPEAIGAFLQTHELSLPVLVDVEGQLTAAFRATAIPQTVLIGKGGRVEAVHVGFDAGKSMSILEKEIETLLAGRRIYQAEEIAEPVDDGEPMDDGEPETGQKEPEKVDKK